MPQSEQAKQPVWTDQLQPQSLPSEWQRRYARNVLVSDTLIVITAVASSVLIRFWVLPEFNSWKSVTDSELRVYPLIGAAIAVSWLVLLAVLQTRPSRRMVGGLREARAVVEASAWLFGAVAVLAYVTQFELARGFVALAFPSGLSLLLLSRWMWRKWMHSQRRQGRMMMPSLVVGAAETVVPIVKDLNRQQRAGYQVVGVCVSDPSNLPSDFAHPLLGSLDDIPSVLEQLGESTLIVAGGDELSPERVRHLSWCLVPGRQHMVVAPALTDIGGPRIHMRPVAGLSLIHVETPKFHGRRAVGKRFVDITLASLALLITSVPLLLCAMIIRSESPGSAIFRQERIGLNGKPFTMYKLRTMRKDAEELKESLLDQRDDSGNEVLFKLKDDPRITKVGKFLRRYSIDELPQFFNVLKGNMSIVGPRPPLAAEVEQYEDHVKRRFLVKPGITGLWQVSGRSNLSWEESVRLDLFYVENWSALGDLLILWRTARAVIAKDGAY